SIWVGSNSGVIQVKNGQSLHASAATNETEVNCVHFTKTEGLPDNTVSAIYEDRHGNLWIGTYGGLCRFINGKFVNETTSEGEPYPQIFCFFEDREDNLWMGSKEGLHQLIPQRFTTYTMRHGLA